jgi:acyl-CoA reductase-like NAD-dependent aldehyde dehydrogenase
MFIGGDWVDELAVLEALENGAPVRQAGAFQIGFSIAHLRYFAGQARTYAFESGVKRESEAVYRVDIVPIGRAQAVT